MKRLREKVDGLHAREPVAEANERARVARQRRRIAGYVDEALRSESGERAEGVGGARARWVENRRVDVTGSDVAQCLRDVRTSKGGACEPETSGVVPRRGDRRGVALDALDRR